MRPIIDSHLDIAWSALYFNRDLLKTVPELRAEEKGLTDEPSRGRNTLTFPELRRAHAAVCLATVMGRSGPDKRTGTKRVDLDYSTQAIAYSHAKGQLAYYRLMEEQGYLRFIESRVDLNSHWQSWSKSPETSPLGVILSMEGADPIVDPDQSKGWYDEGLRVVGPVHYGRSQYGCGTATDGPLSPRGVELLKKFMEVGITLDATHLSDKSFFHALEVYSGPILASHHNCRALVPGDRQMSDEQIRLMIERDGVIGTAFDAWMLYPGWVRGETSPSVVSIEAAANHIDHICQVAGNARHCALGTDLDGGFGTDQTPGDLNTYSDLHKLEAILEGRGYKSADIDGIFYANWYRFFEKTLR